MNKKGIVVISFYDIIAILIFIIGMIFWLMILSPPQRDSVQIREQIHFFDSQDNLAAILDMPIEGKTVLDYIYDGNQEIVMQGIEDSLNPVFGPVCYQMTLDDEIFVSKKCKEVLREELMVAELFVPQNKDEKMKIQLSVPGYAD